MAWTIDIAPLLLKHLLKLERALSAPSPLTKQIGVLVAKDCMKAFEKQRLGDIIWPERYEGMEDPVINIAGALQDFISGRVAPKPNRFQSRPALIDEGMRGGLLASLTPSKSVRLSNPFTVTVGTGMSNKVYALLHQEGGESTQLYDQATKDRIESWLFPKTKTGKPAKKKVTTYGRHGTGQKQKIERSAYAKHMEFLLEPGKFEHTQNVVERPFMGVTDDAESEIRMAIQRYFEKVQS